MGLTDKVTQLKTEAFVAARVAQFWGKQIEAHGERKTTAFYTHLGLNHLEVKSIEWEGLTLSREPTEAEKLCVKSIAGAQETAKKQITDVLLRARERLIKDGLEAITNLSPAKYHTLT